MKYAKYTENGIEVFNTLPHPYKNYNHFPSESQAVIEIEGFLQLQEPVLQQNEVLGEIYQDGNVFKYKIINVVEQAVAQAIALETQNYVKRQQDGVNAYAKISAEFRLAKLNGQISNQAHTVIEETLRPVRNEVLAGQWITALEILQSIGNAVIGQDLYNKLYTQINTYIQQNYE